VNGRDIVIVASNEGGRGSAEEGLPGLGYYTQGSTATSAWTFHSVDPTYRDVHEIATDTLNGVPFFTVGEEEQASIVCNGQGFNDHPSVSRCRVAIFPWNGGGFSSPTIVSERGSQNQTLSQLNGVGYIAGANHNFYNAVDHAYRLWQFNFSTSSGGVLGVAAVLLLLPERRTTLSRCQR
jgi:hypothetical protein